MFWIPRSHETKKCMNGGESDVSCRNPVLALPLQVGEERQDSRWVQVREVEFRHRPIPACGEKPEKQHKAVAVAVDGVRARSAKTWQVVSEVVASDGAKKIGKLRLHRCPPFRPGTGTTNSP